MRSRIWNIAAVFSGFVCAAAIVLWIVSYFRVLGLSNDLYIGPKERGESGIWSTGGRVLLDTTRHTDVSRLPGWRGATFSNDPYVDRPEFVDQLSVTRWHALGFRVTQFITSSGDRTGVEFAAVAIPYWAVVALALLLPGMVFRRFLFRRRRHRLGQCERCGYDLRASAGNCPECGRPGMFRTRAVA